jgi:hypothetical protein
LLLLFFFFGNEFSFLSFLFVCRWLLDLDDTPMSTGGDIFWYKKLAQKYTRYNVIYFNKKGIKSKVQEVVLGKAIRLCLVSIDIYIILF